jgi:hypothetical protein
LPWPAQKHNGEGAAVARLGLVAETAVLTDSPADLVPAQILDSDQLDEEPRRTVELELA